MIQSHFVISILVELERVMMWQYIIESIEFDCYCPSCHRSIAILIMVFEMVYIGWSKD